MIKLPFYLIFLIVKLLLKILFKKILILTKDFFILRLTIVKLIVKKT